MEKKLALLQHLGQSFCEQFGTYYYGSEAQILADYQTYCDTEELDEGEELQDLESWIMDHCTEIDEEIDEDYKVLTDDEADEEWDEQADQYIDDCVIFEIPKHLRSYFNFESYKSDMSYDGRGVLLAPYDHEENEETVFYDGQHVTLYIYRIN